MKRRGFLLLEPVWRRRSFRARRILPARRPIRRKGSALMKNLSQPSSISQTASAGLWPAQTLRTAGAREIGIRFLPFRRAEKRKNILLPRRAASGS